MGQQDTPPPLELAHVYQYGNFYLRRPITPVGSDRQLVRITHFLLQPQIHSRLSWLNVGLLYYVEVSA